MTSARLSAPKHIPYYYNRASEQDRIRVEKTMEHFGFDSDRTLLGESLLRLEQVMEQCAVCLLPTDAPAKALFKMYKFFDSLKYAPSMEHGRLLL